MNDNRQGFWNRLWNGTTPIEVREDTPTPPLGSSVIAPAIYSPSGVSISEALTLPTFYRAADIISGDVSQLEVGTWRAGLEVDPTPLIRQPDPNISRYDFLEMTTLSMVYQGNAYWRVYRKIDTDPVSQVMRLEVLNPLMVDIQVDSLGRKTGYVFNGQPLKLHQIEHLNRFPVLGQPYGLGPIQAAQGFLRGAIDLQSYSDNWLKSGQVPNGVLTTDQVLTPERADEYRQRWIELQREYGRGVAVLGNGMAYAPVYLSPEQAQFLQTQQFTKTQVATLTGVPAYKLNAAVEGANLTYANVQDANREYINDTLMKYLNKIEQALTRLTPRTQTIRFKTEGLLRADYKTQVETIAAAVNAQLMSIPEGRERLELPPNTQEVVAVQGNDTQTA